MSTSELSAEINGAEHPLRSYLEHLMSTGESLAGKLENPVINTGNLQLKLRLISNLGTVVLDLDGTLKSVYLGSRQSDIAGKTADIFCLEIPHVPKGCINSIERGGLDLIKYNGRYSGTYVIRQTVLYRYGLTERGLAGKVLSAIWRTSAEDGYLCLELSSPE